MYTITVVKYLQLVFDIIKESLAPVLYDAYLIESKFWSSAINNNQF